MTQQNGVENNADRKIIKMNFKQKHPERELLQNFSLISD